MPPVLPSTGLAPQAGPAVSTAAKIDSGTILTPEQSTALAREAEEINRHYEDQLIEPWEKAIRFQKLYLQQRKDRRRDDELWRAAVRLPWAFTTIEAAAAQDAEIMMSADPPIQATRIGSDDKEKARVTEALLDYILYGNQFRKLVTLISRARRVVGTDFITSHYAKRSFKMPVFYSNEERMEFLKRVQEAAQLTMFPAPDWQTMPEDFEQWRKTVMLAKPGLKIPAPPIDGPKEIVTYEGPVIARVPFFEVRMDPLIQEIPDQYAVIRRTIRSQKWLMAHTGEGEGQFDPEQVQRALSGWDGKKLQEYEERVAKILGFTVDSERDPYYHNAVEIMEVWRVREEFPYQVILNRQAVINKRPDQFPFMHGQCSIIALRNVLVGGFAYGLSDLAQVETLLHEGDQLRSLRLDAVTLAVLGVYARLQGVGIPDLARRIRPGALIDVPRIDAIKRLLGDSVPEVGFREMYEIKNDIDEGTGVGANVRGAQASINRVPAAESQSRLAQAQLRFKNSIAMLEEDLNPAIPQWLSLLYQFGSPKLRAKVSGGLGDGWVTVPKEQLIEAFTQDLRFQGATQSISNEILVQQLTQYGKEFAPYFAPHEQRELMKRIAELSKMKDIDSMITADVTKLMQQVWVKEQQVKAGLVQAQATAVEANPQAALAGTEGGGGGAAPAAAPPAAQ